MDMTIPYRIERIETSQFAIFPDKVVNGEDVSIEVNMNFSVSNNLTPLKSVTNVRYIQNDNLLMVLEINCFFAISEDGQEAIKKNGKIPVDFLRYMGTFAIGIARGVIHARTEGTVLSPVVLPPINLNDTIDKDIVIKKEKAKAKTNKQADE